MSRFKNYEDGSGLTEAERSYQLGGYQRNENNGAGGLGFARDVHFYGWPTPAVDEEAYVAGYVEHGDDYFDWY